MAAMMALRTARLKAESQGANVHTCACLHVFKLRCVELLHGCASSEQAFRAKCLPCQRGRRVKCTGVHFEMNTQIRVEWANSSGRGNQFNLFKLFRNDHFTIRLMKHKIYFEIL